MLTDVVSSIARADGDKWVVSVRVYYTGSAAAAGHVITATTADAKVRSLRCYRLTRLHARSNSASDARSAS